MYIDFMDLNKACPNDPFLILKIDQLIDATFGHPRMSFLDAFQGYLSNLTKTFKTPWKHCLKLNASKCAFKVSLGKLLRYLVTNQGIEVYPNQIVALQNLKPPRNLKEV